MSSKSDHILTLSFRTNQGSVTLPAEIPAQTLTLKAYRYRWSSLTHLQNNPIIFVDLPFTDALVRTGNSSSTKFPILTGLNATWCMSTDISVALDKPIPKKFEYRICGTDQTVLDDTHLIDLDLVFEYNTAIL